MKYFQFLLFGCSLSGFSQTLTDTLTYTRQEVMIPMRDGVKLNTVIYSPQSKQSPWPILFTRTPYGVHDTPSPNKRDYIMDMA